MSVTNPRAAEVTRRKLGELEEAVRDARADSASPDHIREVTVRSLMKLVNQLREELIRYEAHTRDPAVSA